VLPLLISFLVDISSSGWVFFPPPFSHPISSWVGFSFFFPLSSPTVLPFPTEVGLALLQPSCFFLPTLLFCSYFFCARSMTHWPLSGISFFCPPPPPSFSALVSRLLCSPEALQNLPWLVWPFSHPLTFRSSLPPPPVLFPFFARGASPSFFLRHCACEDLPHPSQPRFFSGCPPFFPPSCGRFALFFISPGFCHPSF